MSVSFYVWLETKALVMKYYRFAAKQSRNIDKQSTEHERRQVKYTGINMSKKSL